MIPEKPIKTYYTLYEAAVKLKTSYAKIRSLLNADSRKQKTGIQVGRNGRIKLTVKMLELLKMKI